MISEQFTANLHQEVPLSIKFQVKCDSTKFGEGIIVTGDIPTLGMWNPKLGVELTTDGLIFPLWRSVPVDAQVNPGKKVIEYKYLKRTNDHHFSWEKFKDNRKIVLSELEKIPSNDKQNFVEVIDESFDKDIKPKIFLPPKGEFKKEVTECQKTQENKKTEPAVTKEIEKVIMTSDSPFKPELDSDSEEIIKEISDLDKANGTWKDKLEGIFELLKKADNKLTNQLISISSIYLHFINSGEIKCMDEGHFRPNHHSNLAFLIYTELLKAMNQENSIIIRSILKNLPSFSDQYRVTVPLTRIRDIAHRNDIPKELKDEIKKRLQNKLHRSASPDDLRTCEYFINKITAPGTNYSHDFIEQFKIFQDELTEFFNALGLEKSLIKLKELLGNNPLCGDIDKFLSIKKEKPEKNLKKLQQGLALRQSLKEVIMGEMGKEEAQCNKTLLQMSSNCEIEIETFSFALMSEYLEKFYYSNKKEKNYQNLLEMCDVCLDSLILSNVKTEECESIKNDLIHFSRDFLFQDGKSEIQANYRLSLLKLKAVFERCYNLFYVITEEVNKVYTNPLFNMGRALGVNEKALTVFVEGFIRQHTIFQFSKVVTLLINKIREMLDLLPYVIINPGEDYGLFLHLDSLDDYAPNKGNYILFLENSDGTEEIPTEIKGIVVAHDLPQLSHVAIRARQNKVTFVCCLERKMFDNFITKSFHAGDWVKLSVKGEHNIDIAKIKESEIPKNIKKFDRRMSEKLLEQIGAESTKCLDPGNAPKDIFIEIENTEQCFAGAKTTNMKELARIKIKNEPNSLFETPLSYCIPYSVYLRYSSVILSDDLLSLVDECDMKDLEANSDMIREMFIEKCMSSEIDLLDVIVGRIKETYINRKLLAIRSSSNLEDLKKSAGAGLFDSYIGIDYTDASEIKRAIVKVWASLFTYRALLARRKGSIPSSEAKMAVLVQEMIEPELCFVIHSVNPITKDRSEVYIEMAVGLGETLASASQRGSPYRMMYNKISGEATILNFSSFSQALKGYNKMERISYREVELSINDQLAVDMATRLGKMSEELENEFNCPQDIEGGIVNDTICLVQTRPQLI